MTTASVISEYTLQGVTMTFSSGPAGSLVVSINFEGSATGFGPVFGTMNAASAGQRAGTYDWYGATFPSDGEGIVGRGQGTFTSIGTNRWATRGPMAISDGRAVILEGIVDLAARSWNGKILASVG